MHLEIYGGPDLVRTIYGNKDNVPPKLGLILSGKLGGRVRWLESSKLWGHSIMKAGRLASRREKETDLIRLRTNNSTFPPGKQSL